MQALSMIDMGAKAPENVAPAKSAEPQDKHFGQVLGEQRQPEQQPVSQNTETRQATPAQKQPEQQADSNTAQAEEQPVALPKVEQNIEVQHAATQLVNTESAPRLKQTVLDLMKVLVGSESSEMTEAVVAGEALPQVDKSAAIEDLLVQMVQQLEGNDLPGEQVLAGIDLSPLVEQLQVISENGNEEQLVQLVVQLEDQLATEEGLLANAELAAGMLPTDDVQAATPKLVESLAQARQILQNAINSVAAQRNPQVTAEETVAAEEIALSEEVIGQKLVAEQDTTEKVDPRFAGLLKPRTENQQPQQSLRQRVQENNPTMNQAQLKPAAEATVQQVPEITTEPGKFADFVEQLASKPKQVFENLTQPVQGQVQSNATALAQSITGKVMPDAPMVQLPSGQQVAESQIFDQVVARFSGNFNGESSRMVLRLQPAELGSLKLELIVEGDRVRASLQAQSLQVQEILERNLPQLRNALAEQGLKIDQFQVNVNQDQSQQDQFDQLAQQQQQRRDGNARSQMQPAWEPEEQIIPLAHLMQNGGGGISLHV